jgi:hypothetical protein
VFTPADILNRSLDAIGKPDMQLGAITDGTLAGRTSRRIYGQTLRALLRTAHWSFARRKAPMQLLADNTGQTLTPQGTPYPTTVERPWRFAYAWPTDCLQARWLPWDGNVISGGSPSGNIALPNTPLMTGLQQNNGPWLYEKPARFLSSTSTDFPLIVGQADWAQIDSVLDDIEGAGLKSRRVILTNVPYAHLVYTMLVTEIEMWDELFSQAMVAVLAERLSMPLLKDDPKAMLAVRNTQIAIAKDAIRDARAASANEAGFPQSTDQTPDWVRARRARSGFGGGWDASGAGAGYLFGSWSPFSFGDGSVM